MQGVNKGFKELGYPVTGLIICNDDEYISGTNKKDIFFKYIFHGPVKQKF